MKLGLITDIHEKVDLLRSALDDLKRDLTVGVTGLAGLIVLLLCNVCLFALDRFVSAESLAELPDRG